jgi:hypothetical protein
VSLSADLERLERQHTAWDEYLSDGLVAWAADTVDAEERDLGRLAEWAETVCERRQDA